MEAALPGILENATAKLSGALRLLLAQLKVELDQLTRRIEEADAVLKQTAQEDEACQRLVAIPGIAAGYGDRAPRRHRQRQGSGVCRLDGSGATRKFHRQAEAAEYRQTW